jgi:hypothetical protein
MLRGRGAAAAGGAGEERWDAEEGGERGGREGAAGGGTEGAAGGGRRGGVGGGRFGGRGVGVGVGVAVGVLVLVAAWLPAAPLGQEEAGVRSGVAAEDETPLEPLDRGDGVILKHGLDQWAVRRKAVLVVGLESSGSKLVARAVARRIVYPGASRPWGWEGDWDGHGAVGNASLGTFVLHRSLPHNDHFPDLDTILGQLAFLRFEVFVVVATRDREISFRSVLGTHQPDAGVARREHHAAVRALVNLLQQRKYRATVFSHEALVLLGDVYFLQLFDFLNEPLAPGAPPPPPPSPEAFVAPGAAPPPPIPRAFVAPEVREANAKYVAPESLWEALQRAVLFFWAPRRPTVGRAV